MSDLARLHICVVSPEPWLIALKRMGVNEGSGQIVYTNSYDLGTYRICEQRRTRRACTFAQSRQIMFDFYLPVSDKMCYPSSRKVEKPCLDVFAFFPNGNQTSVIVTMVVSSIYCDKIVHTKKKLLSTT